MPEQNWLIMRTGRIILRGLLLSQAESHFEYLLREAKVQSGANVHIHKPEPEHKLTFD